MTPKGVQKRVLRFANLYRAYANDDGQCTYNRYGGVSRGRIGISCDDFAAEFCLCWPVSTSRNRHNLSYSGLFGLVSSAA